MCLAVSSLQADRRRQASATAEQKPSGGQFAGGNYKGVPAPVPPGMPSIGVLERASGVAAGLEPGFECFKTRELPKNLVKRLSPEEAKVSVLHDWEYTDDMGVVQVSAAFISLTGMWGRRIEVTPHISQMHP